MKEKERIQKILKALEKEYANVRCALQHESPFQLLVATILSAQCTDKKVNEVTPDLFKCFPTPESFAKASIENIEHSIRSIGLFRSKAKNIKKMSEVLVSDFNSEVPNTLDQLVSLAGVGRKTANVVLGEVFGKSEGVVVDTHVARISQLLGLTKHTDALKIERDLIKKIPEKSWVQFSHRLIWHGRLICIARRPQCHDCVLLSLCPRKGLKKLAPAKPKALQLTKTGELRAIEKKKLTKKRHVNRA